MKVFPVFASGALLFASAASAATINVPADQATIQDAVNAASNGDTVLVAPGTYYELINFDGKAITVTSSGGAAVTILDGQNSGPIVTFNHSEGNSSVLQGFKLTHAANANGAGVHMSGTVSPQILDNIFASDVESYGYTGAAIGGAGTPIILRNFFEDNTCTVQATDGVVVLSGSPVIADNVFVNNTCPAIYEPLTSGETPEIYNNTMAGNRDGVLMISYTANASVIFSNNIIVFNQYGLNVSFSGPGTMPSWSHNLVYGNSAADYQGIVNPTGTNGNVSADPQLAYWVGGDVHLLSGSPAIDVGDSTVTQASSTDFYGDPRVAAGNPGDSAVVDIGADEATGTAYVVPPLTIINVPTDEPTIQAAIEAASDGEVVLVAPGTYYEQLNYEGKPITVKSSGGAAVTILDGNDAGPIVSFSNNEGNYAILQGFTLTHAVNDENKGAAVYMFGNVSPTIEDDVFIDNLDYLGSGAAISAMASSAGTGFSPVIVRNYFSGNSGFSGGSNAYCVVYVQSEASPVVADNVFANNPIIAYYQVLSNYMTAPRVYNNTFVGDTVGLDLGSATGITAGTLFSNNVLAFNQIGVKVSLTNGAASPPFSHNLAYGNTTADYSGVTSQTGTNGNISANPLLKDWETGDVHLLYGSPAIDVGDTSVTQVSSTDFYGNTRVYAGMPGDSAIVDIGAVEYEPPVITAVDGAIQTPPGITASSTLTSANADSTEPLTFTLVALPTHGTVTLTNAGTGAFQYVPAQGYLGSDSFTFEVTDPYGTVSNIATEQVTVQDLPPVANNGSVNTTVGTEATAALSATAAYSGQTLSFALVSSPAHGTVTVGADGQFTYKPVQAYIGTDSFSFDVTDAYGMVSNTATEQVNIGDGTPTANNGSIQTTPDIAVNAALSATPGYNGQKLTFSLVSNPAHGTVSLTAGSGSFRYTPATGYAGTDSFSFEVTDTYGKVSNVATESVTVTDVAAQLGSGQISLFPNAWVGAGSVKSTLAYKGQVLTFSVVAQPLHGSVRITNAKTGAFTYTLSGEYKGKDSFTVQAVDQWGTSTNAATITVQVM